MYKIFTNDFNIWTRIVMLFEKEILYFLVLTFVTKNVVICDGDDK